VPRCGKDGRSQVRIRSHCNAFSSEAQLSKLLTHQNLVGRASRDAAVTGCARDQHVFVGLYIREGFSREWTRGVWLHHHAISRSGRLRRTVMLGR